MNDEYTGADSATVDTTPGPAPNVERFAYVRLDAIAPSLVNRKHFDEAKMLDLAESIKASGVHQPILLRPLPQSRLEDTFHDREPGTPLPVYELVCGERRWRASKAVGTESIPAMIRALSDAQALEIQLVENLQREDLNELEEAEGYERLMKETQLSADAIGEKIGKSRSYVYQRLKLLDLCQEGREAMRGGKLDFTKAVLVARIPDPTLQIKAVREFTRTDHGGDVIMGTRAAQAWVRQNVMVPLRDARFGLGDADLVPAAGPCTRCPKRSGANPDLFADVDGPDVCTDPDCFDTKQQAHTTRQVDQLRNRGLEVIEGKEAAEIKPYPGAKWLNGYVSIDDTSDGPSIRETLSKQDLKGKVKAYVDPHGGGVIEVVSDEVARLARAKQMTPEQKKVAAKHKQEEREHEMLQKRQSLELEYHRRWHEIAVYEMVPRVRAGELGRLEAPLLRVIWAHLVDNRMDYESMCRGLDVEVKEDEIYIQERVNAADDVQLGAALVCALLHNELTPQSTWSDGVRAIDEAPAAITSVAASLGVDLDAIRKSVQDAMRNDLAAQQGKGKGGGKAAAAKSPAAPAKKRKLSAEEAQQSIADALQGCEPASAEPTDAGPAGGGLEVLQHVQFVDDLKGPGGKLRKCSGKKGHIESIIGGGSEMEYMVRTGPKPNDVHRARRDELVEVPTP